MKKTRNSLLPSGYINPYVTLLLPISAAIVIAFWGFDRDTKHLQIQEWWTHTPDYNTIAEAVGGDTTFNDLLKSKPIFETILIISNIGYPEWKADDFTEPIRIYYDGCTILAINDTIYSPISFKPTFNVINNSEIEIQGTLWNSRDLIRLGIIFIGNIQKIEPTIHVRIAGLNEENIHFSRISQDVIWR